MGFPEEPDRLYRATTLLDACKNMATAMALIRKRTGEATSLPDILGQQVVSQLVAERELLSGAGAADRVFAQNLLTFVTDPVIQPEIEKSPLKAELTRSFIKGIIGPEAPAEAGPEFRAKTLLDTCRDMANAMIFVRMHLADGQGNLAGVLGEQIVAQLFAERRLLSDVGGSNSRFAESLKKFVRTPHIDAQVVQSPVGAELTQSFTEAGILGGTAPPFGPGA